jgi:hypothetical protein
VELTLEERLMIGRKCREHEQGSCQREIGTKQGGGDQTANATIAKDHLRELQKIN